MNYKLKQKHKTQPISKIHCNVPCATGVITPSSIMPFSLLTFYFPGSLISVACGVTELELM